MTINARTLVSLVSLASVLGAALSVAVVSFIA